MSDGSAMPPTAATDIEGRMVGEIHDAYINALKSLARYKFVQGGYWIGVWVHLNRIHGGRSANPFRHIVLWARRELARLGEAL